MGVHEAVRKVGRFGGVAVVGASLYKIGTGFFSEHPSDLGPAILGLLVGAILLLLTHKEDTTNYAVREVGPDERTYPESKDKE